MAEKTPVQPRGVLRLAEGRRHFQLNRALPSVDLAETVEHFWSVQWNLTGRAPYVSETLPHPSVHLVFESGASEIVGVMRGRFTRTLEGDGCVFGVKFLPGAFRSVCGLPVSRFTNRRLHPADFFRTAWSELEKQVLGSGSVEARAARAEDFLRTLHLQPDADARLVRNIIAAIAGDPALTRVDAVASKFAVNKRQLQRLFSNYAGVSPKWVIERYRMHEALEQLSSGKWPDMALLAHSLGYFDQAHFHKAFRSLTGVSPGDYASKN